MYLFVSQGCYLIMWCTRTHIHNHSETHTSPRAAVQRSGLIYSAESSPRSVMRASGIIKFGPAGSFRLVDWLTLSCWLAASMTTDWVCAGRPVSRLIDYMHVCREVWRAGWLAGWLPFCCYFCTDWLGGWLMSCWFVGSWLTDWLTSLLAGWLAGCIDGFLLYISLGHHFHHLAALWLHSHEHLAHICYHQHTYPISALCFIQSE